MTAPNPALSSNTYGNGAAIENLRRELVELRAENDRLRGLLGLDDRPGDGHAGAWVPTLLAEPTEQPAVDGSSTAADKLALFWSLFGARSDVARLPVGEGQLVKAGRPTR